MHGMLFKISHVPIAMKLVNYAYTPFVMLRVYPTALSTYGKLRQTTKSHSLKIFDKHITAQAERPSNISAVLLDGAAIGHMVLPSRSRNFQDYVDTEIASFSI